MSLDTLNAQFGLPNHLVFAAGPNNLLVANISTPAADASITLLGGHVFSYQPHGRKPVLWLSPNSVFEVGQPIRGGIPVCWPWFASHPTDATAPGHGFARLAEWSVLGSELLIDGGVQLRLGLSDAQASHPLWPQPYRLELIITVGAALDVTLCVSNPGDAPFTCTGALHTYFNISDIHTVAVRGLDGVDYLDKVANFQRKTQQGDVTFSGETDRIYLDTAGDCQIIDSDWQRTIRVAKSGSQSTVVWNPGAAKPLKSADMGRDTHLTMVCVETANAADDVIVVSPGGEHRLQTIISVE